MRLGLDTHKHRRSLNVLVIGGSGAAKTRGYVKPNILEANSNYVITDPKMEVLTATGGYLKRQGYDIRVLNLVDLSQSDGYNPFRYLRDEKDALKLVNTLIQATTPKGSHESDPFWSKSETALLQAIILMLFQEAPEYEQNFSMVMRVLEYAVGEIPLGKILMGFSNYGYNWRLPWRQGEAAQVVLLKGAAQETIAGQTMR